MSLSTTQPINFFTLLQGDFIMIIKAREKGQALILIVLVAIGLFAFAALAIDGSRVFSDKRHAQNAADTAALAGALAHARGNDINTTAQDRATSNGYDNGTKSDVTITITDAPNGVCPANTTGKDITVTIVSYVETTFARILGRTQVENAVTATSRSCGSFYGPPFDGNAIVSLAPDGIGYEGMGNADWIIEGGGIYSNSTGSAAAHCNGNPSITVPSVTVAGHVSWGSNCAMNISGSTNQNSPQLSYSIYSALFPREPVCDGTATPSGGKWHPQAGKDGSKVTLSSGDEDFAPGLYCIMNTTIGPYHGELTGTELTFYIPSSSFSLKFDGSGNSFNATAPTDPDNEYKGVLIFMKPQVDASGHLMQTQQLDLRGNGSQDTVGSIIAPSAYVTMFGNSSSDALINSQIIAYKVDSQGTADIHITYMKDDNYNKLLPISLALLK
jgi:Flp pilus assembly protein TadG